MAPWRARRRHRLSLQGTQAAFDLLRSGSEATRELRDGLTPAAAAATLAMVRGFFDHPAIYLTAGTELVAGRASCAQHDVQCADLARAAIDHGGAFVTRAGIACDHRDCLIKCALAVPIVRDGEAIGTLQVFGQRLGARTIDIATEVAIWVASQLDLAELAASRARLAEAELRTLRAQISPHFIYNALGAIASFVRTDPERARELLLEFADFTRYSFRDHGEFVTLEEELHAVEHYLRLEQARFGTRLKVTLRVAPEVLPVKVPYLCVQPLVENACQHGLEGRSEGGQVTIVARGDAADCVVTVEDDGQGADPEVIRRALAGSPATDSRGVALHNVDERLRLAFGNDYGLVIETAPGAGTKATTRIPKYAPAVAR